MIGPNKVKEVQAFPSQSWEISYSDIYTYIKKRHKFVMSEAISRGFVQDALRIILSTEMNDDTNPVARYSRHSNSHCSRGHGSHGWAYYGTSESHAGGFSAGRRP